MNAFTLDTSGVIHFGGDAYRPAGHFRWPDLDPFTQGYVEAAKQAFPLPTMPDPGGETPSHMQLDWGFSDLASETLATILKDCARALSFGRYANTEAEGRVFWRSRQTGRHGDGFPPLTISLGDDGKVYLK